MVGASLWLFVMAMVLLGCPGLVLVSVLMLIGLVVKLAARESPFLPGLDASAATQGEAARLGGILLGEAPVDGLGTRAARPASMGNQVTLFTS